MAIPRPQPRLHIPPSINSHPVTFDGQPLFSPALPSALQNQFHPSIPMSAQAVMTPHNRAFFNQQPGGPAPQSMHRSHPSLAQGQMMVSGAHPPLKLHIPPGSTSTMFPPHLALIPPGSSFSLPPPPFPSRPRRTPSISTGGPPKAPLGGPQRRLSPMPLGTPSGTLASSPLEPKYKGKKVIVKLPTEATSSSGASEQLTVTLFRTPIPMAHLPAQNTVAPAFPDLCTAEIYPPEEVRGSLPPSIEVFLPGKTAWDDYKRNIMEEKLAKLGVERGSGSTFGHLLGHGIHSRAMSISSPADPALLLFKLNKLQQSQTAMGSSLSVSPQPSLSSSPNHLPPRLQSNRHAHSISLANSPSYFPPLPQLYSTTGAFNPFGPTATLGSDQILQRRSSDSLVPVIHAPQGIVATNPLSLRSSSGMSRPDFNRGFGLDITEEDEETELPNDGPNSRNPQESEADGNDTFTTPAQSRLHSRHLSRASIALSLKSLGRGRSESGIEDGAKEQESREERRWGSEGGEEREMERDPVAEWTGSEDLRTGVVPSEDGQSTGEWSNPSDEARARHYRLQEQSTQEVPRRLPNFPQPPQTFHPLDRSSQPDSEDIISNPSEEEQLSRPAGAHHEGPSSQYDLLDSTGRSSRPLPPLPHSRAPSGQYMTPPHMVHSRQGSSQAAISGDQHPGTHVSFSGSISTARPLSPPQLNGGRRDSLNPHAKPFVFGAGPGGFAVTTIAASLGLEVPPQSRAGTHTRQSSRVLNAAALEFKPTGFTFRPPPGVPSLVFPPPVEPRPLPEPPLSTTSARAVQGREKRQRRSSSPFDEEPAALDESSGGIDNIASFRFPSEPKLTPPATSNISVLNASAKPFTFPSHSLADSFLPMPPPMSPLPFSGSSISDLPPLPKTEQVTPKGPQLPAPVSEPTKREVELSIDVKAATMKTRRPPIPDFHTYPVSTNTVPAALFKALSNSDIDGPPRPTVRSRLSSREVFEHNNRPSLDDIHMPSISRKTSKGRLVALDLETQPPDLFSPAIHTMVSVAPPAITRSSIPKSAIGSPASDSILSSNTRKRFEMEQFERNLETMLEDKMESIRSELMLSSNRSSGFNAGSTDSLVPQVVAAVRLQLKEIIAQRTEDIQSVVDWDAIKKLIHIGNQDLQRELQRDLSAVMRRLDNQPYAHQSTEVLKQLQDTGDHIINGVNDLVRRLVSQIENIGDTSQLRPIDDRQQFLRDLVTVLAPHLESIRSEPIDVDLLTMQLSEAVKPHIHQLIDLASDKKETAGMIVHALAPLLSSGTGHIDNDAIAAQLVDNIAHLIPQVDHHALTEQVADLVVERLDSRLLVRDQAFAPDTISKRVSESLSLFLKPLANINTVVDSLTTGQVELSAHTTSLLTNQQDILLKLGAIPKALSDQAKTLLSDGKGDLLADYSPGLATIQSAINELASGQVAITSHTSNLMMQQTETASRISEGVESLLKSVKGSHAELLANVSLSSSSDQATGIHDALQTLITSHNTLATQSDTLLSNHDDVVTRLSTLPELFTAANERLQSMHAEVMDRIRGIPDPTELQSLRTSNMEMQIQLVKARASHGQVRSEKDLLNERLLTSEADREQLRVDAVALKNTLASRDSELASSIAKVTQLEGALAQALAKLKESDTIASTQRDHIAASEKANRQSQQDASELRSRVQKLELEATFKSRDLDASQEIRQALERERDHLAGQQKHWDELRRTADHIETLAKLVGSVESDELKELKRIRDRSKVQEGELQSLQKRYNDQESKLIALQRASLTAKQGIAQAQQRASEWEKRTKDLESELESTRITFDRLEESRNQLDADLSLLKLQLEEKELQEASAKEREKKLLQEVSSLRLQLTALKADSGKTKQSTVPASLTSKPQWALNKSSNGHDSRPSSRISEVSYPSRPSTATPIRQSAYPPANGTSETVTQPDAVWQSMHAPQYRPAQQPRLHRHSSYKTTLPSSPTPSTVSLAPTVNDDGWWS